MVESSDWQLAPRLRAFGMLQRQMIAKFQATRNQSKNECVDYGLAQLLGSAPQAVLRHLGLRLPYAQAWWSWK